MNKFKRFIKRLGPGLITGAADDDPSGIATYSIAGAQFGYQLLWTAVVTFPLMVVIQETCARIGVVTKHGLARVIKDNYPRPLLILVTTLLFAANTFNIGANISGMAAAIRLIFPVSELYASFIIAATMIFLIIRLPYNKIKAIFKWLAMVLLFYVIAFMLVQKNIKEVIGSLFLPANYLAIFSSGYLLTLLAIFGTTISPYLFFWQTSEEAEEEISIRHKSLVISLKNEKEDTIYGMLFSNVMMFFIIATCSVTLFNAGINNISTAAEAALALRPIAGDWAFLLFSLGIIGTGMLAIPVLAGSAAYAISETFGFSEGLNKPFHKAKAFYLIIIISTLIGFVLNFIGIPSIKYLLYSAVFNGLAAPILIAVIFLIGNNKKIMGNFTNNRFTNCLTIFTLAIMSLAAAALFFIR